MTELLKSVRTMKNWEERTVWEDGSGRKVANAVVTYSTSGDVTGESTLDYSMVYLTPAHAIFSGFETISATVGGQAGTLVLHHNGVFENGAAKVTVQVVAEAGIGIFGGRSGSGQIDSDSQDPMKGYLTLSLQA